MPEGTFASSFQWSQKYIDPIRTIVGYHLMQVAPEHEDTREATDLLVFKARDMRVAARIRSTQSVRKYPWQFTLRSQVGSGNKTELEKMREGWGDLLFYGRATADETRLDRWFLVDLSSWRAHLMDGVLGGGGNQIAHGERTNGDGTAFHWFDLRGFLGKPPILTAYGLDGDRQVVHDYLVSLARKGAKATYTEVGQQVGLSMNDNNDRACLRDWLGEISTFEVLCGRPMLSAVVVKSQGGVPGDNPGQGFFTLAEDLGRDVSTPADFFKSELAAVHAQWG